MRKMPPKDPQEEEFEKWSDFLPKKFCCYFSLRFGVTVIAITELALASFATVILIICAVKYEEMMMENFSDSVDDNPVNITWRQLFERENIKYQENENYDSVTLLSIYMALVLTTTHILTCLLLLYGAMKNIAKLALPFLTTATLILIVTVLLSIAYYIAYYQSCLPLLYFITQIIMVFECHSFVIAWGYYYEGVYREAAQRANNLMVAYEKESLMDKTPIVATVKLSV